MRILITRPLEDGEEIASTLTTLGHEPLLAPMLSTHFHDGTAPALDDVQAILATSANGVRAFARLSPMRDIPVFAVGPQTTAEALGFGFTTVRNADGDALMLARATAGWADAKKGALLHVCGEEAPGTLGAALTPLGFAVRRAELYRVDAAPALPDAARIALEEGKIEGALFYSARSARVFSDLTAHLSIQAVEAFCISPATASALDPVRFRTLHVAAAPNQDALLALLPPA
jgi:uroporphyrinogen-III synthase